MSAIPPQHTLLVCVYCYELPWGLQKVFVWKGRPIRRPFFCYYIKAKEKLKRPLDGARFFLLLRFLTSSLPFFLLELCRVFPPARSSPFCQSRFLCRSKRTRISRFHTLPFLLHTHRGWKEESPLVAGWLCFWSMLFDFATDSFIWLIISWLDPHSSSYSGTFRRSLTSSSLSWI